MRIFLCVLVSIGGAFIGYVVPLCLDSVVLPRGKFKSRHPSTLLHYVGGGLTVGVILVLSLTSMPLLRSAFLGFIIVGLAFGFGELLEHAWKIYRAVSMVSTDASLAKDYLDKANDIDKTKALLAVAKKLHKPWSPEHRTLEGLALEAMNRIKPGSAPGSDQAQQSEWTGRPCAYCHTPFQPGDKLEICYRCTPSGLPYHQRCWAKLGSCATPGCHAIHGTVIVNEKPAAGQAGSDAL